MAKTDDYVYLVGGGSVYVFDVSNPAEPDLLARKPLISGQDAGETDQVAIAIEGRFAYVLHGGLWVLDLLDPAKPEEVAYYPTAATVIDAEDGRIALGGVDGTFTLLRYSLGQGGP